MQLPDETANTDHRRGQGKRSVYSLMHATATLIDSTHTEQIPLDMPALYWTGLLTDISDEGAQITMSYNRAKYFERLLRVNIEIRTTLKGLNAEVTAGIKSIEVAPDNNSVTITVRFTDIESNKKARDVIARICELGKMLEGANAKEAEQILFAEYLLPPCPGDMGA
jgi:hypothetical protein